MRVTDADVTVIWAGARGIRRREMIESKSRCKEDMALDRHAAADDNNKTDWAPLVVAPNYSSCPSGCL